MALCEISAEQFTSSTNIAVYKSFMYVSFKKSGGSGHHEQLDSEIELMTVLANV